MGKASRRKKERRESGEARQLKRIRRSTDMQVERREYSDGTVEITLSEEMAVALAAKDAHFQENFDRALSGDDPVIFDLDDDDDLGGLPQEKEAMAAMIKAMESASIDPELIEVYRRTGLLLTEESMTLAPPERLLEWDAVTAEVRGETLKDYELAAANAGALVGDFIYDPETGFDYDAPNAPAAWVFEMASILSKRGDQRAGEFGRRIALMAWTAGRLVASPAPALGETGPLPFYLLAVESATLAKHIRVKKPSLHKRAVSHAALFNGAAEYAEFAQCWGDYEVFLAWIQQTDPSVACLMMASVLAVALENDNCGDLFDEAIERINESLQRHD